MEKTKSILTPHQRAVLDFVSQEPYFNKRYYLAGGTALAEFYLKHRLSEDLDFFVEQEEVDPLAVSQFFQKHQGSLQINRLETKKFLGLHSFFVHFTDQSVLKVDFNYYPFPRIEKGARYNQFEIESIYDIGVDKVHTIALKPRARDFIDIYFIIKEKGYQLHNLLMQAKAKFGWDITALELAARLSDASTMTDFPRMIKKINHSQWQQFFVNEAKKLEQEIFE